MKKVLMTMVLLIIFTGCARDPQTTIDNYIEKRDAFIELTECKATCLEACK